MSANKYRNIQTEIDGIVLSSKREAIRYAELKLLLSSRLISKLELQKRFPFIVNGVKVCEYRADFSYFDKDGREIIEDVKGVRTRDYIIKSKLMIACYGIRIVEV